MMKHLKVLLVSPVFHNYGFAVLEELKNQSFSVKYFLFQGEDDYWFSNNEKNRSFSLLKNKIIALVTFEEFDYLLVINSELFDDKMLEIFKKRNPGSKLIFYLWDPISSVRGRINVRTLLKYTHRYTFELGDVKNYPELKLIHRPTFFHPDLKRLQCLDNKYDIAMVCSIQPHRIFLLKKIYNKCSHLTLRFHIYMESLKSIPVYLLKYSLLINLFKVKMKKLTLNESFLLLSNSKSILDIAPKNQYGLTLRCLDALGLEKKLITTNPEIAKYDFYDPSNVLIVSDNNLDRVEEFLKKPSVKVPDCIREKYSLAYWVRAIMNNDEIQYVKADA